MRNVVIVGSGCAGNTAAIYTARANLSPLVITGHEQGGQLSLTTSVENFPGFPEGVQGPALVESIRQQAVNFGAEYVSGAVIEADLSVRPFRLNVEGEWIETKALIIASGASARWLGLESEKKLIGHGVSSCATCDGFFYRGKKIMVVGGGDSAMEEANFLTHFGSEVAVVHRREQFRASHIMLERARGNPKIKFLLNAVVEEVLDVEKGRLRPPKDGLYDVEVILVDGSLFPHKGRITFAAPSFSAETGTFLVRASIPNPDGVLRPNAYVRARLVGAVRPNAIVVPQRAVQQGSEGNFVWVVDKEGKARPRPVQVGRWQESDWFVSEGLHDGDRVVVDGAMTLHAGTPVVVKPGA